MQEASMPAKKTPLDEGNAASAENHAQYLQRQALYKAFLWITHAEALERDAALAPPRAFRDRKLPGRLRAHARRLVKASGVEELETMRAEHGDDETERRLLGVDPEAWKSRSRSSHLEELTLSPANPNRALALAMRGEPTEDFTSPRGRSIVDGVRHFTPDRWREFVDFYAAKDRGERAEDSYWTGWEIFVGAWERIVTAVRNGEIKWSAIPDDAALPVEMPGDSLGLVQLTGFDKISQSEVIINGRRFVDVRFQAVKDAPGVLPPPKGITEKEVREAIEAAGPEPKAYTIATGLKAKYPDDPRTHDGIRTKVRRGMAK
jgi:hypothetical protein